MIAAPPVEDPIAWPDLESRFWGMFAPPPAPRPLMEFAGTLKLVETKRRGEAAASYDPKSHPAQWYILTAVQAGLSQKYVILGPTQDGKTLVTVIVPMLYVLTELQQPAIYGAPDMKLAADTLSEKILPMMAASGMSHFLPQDGAGSQGGTNVSTIHFHGAATLFLMGAGGKNQSGQASRTACYVFKDEVDSIKPKMLPLMDRRTDVFDDLARIFETSTIKDDRTSRILLRYADSTRGRLWFACPRCGRFQTFEWSRVKCDDTDDLTARDTVRLHCAFAECDHPMTEADRQQAIASDHRLVQGDQTVDAQGVVTGDAPRSLTFGLRWTALDSPLKSLPKLAVEFRAAKLKAAASDHEDLRNFYRDRLTEAYTGDLDQTVELSLALIYQRSAASHYQAGDVPPGVEYLTAAVDQQARWLYWVVRGYSLANDAGSFERYLIAAGVEQLQHIDGPMAGQPLGPKDEPTQEQRHAALERVARLMANGFPKDGVPMVPIRKALDVGMWLTDVRPWLARSPDWTGVAGRGAAQVLRQLGATSGNRLVFIPGVVDVRQQQDAYGVWALWLIDADKVRGSVHNGLLMEPGTPGCGYVFRGIAKRSATEWIARHLVGEYRVRDEASGEVTWEKRSSDARVDILDGCVYADAVGIAHAEYLRAARAAAKPAGPAPYQPPTTPPRSPFTPRRHGRFRS